MKLWELLILIYKWYFKYCFFNFNIMANYKNYKNEDIDLDVLIESLNENDLKLDLIRKNIIDPDQ